MRQKYFHLVQQQSVSKSCNSGQQPALIGGAAEAGVPQDDLLVDHFTPRFIFLNTLFVNIRKIFEASGLSVMELVQDSGRILLV